MLVKMNVDDHSSVSEEDLKQQDADEDSHHNNSEETKVKANDHEAESTAVEDSQLAARDAKKSLNVSDGDKEGSSSLYRIDSGLLPFPEKLMALLDGNQVSDSMWWLPDGDSFCLIPVVFAEKVLDKHFQGTKFESFTRKLNRWGFKRVAGQKVPANTIAYYNKYFIRGQPKLLKNMNGGKTKLAASRESKRVLTKMRRDRQQEQDVLLAAQQQALYAESLGYPNSNPLFRPGLSTLLAGGFNGAGANDIRTNQILASELMAQREREELQMRLALSQRGGAFNPLLASSSGAHVGINHPMLAGAGHHPQRLTPLEQQILMARSSTGFSDFSSMGGGGGLNDVFKNNNGGGSNNNMDGSNGGGSASAERSNAPTSSDLGNSQQNQFHHHNNNNLRALAAAKAAGASQQNNNNSQGVDPQLLQYLQEEQRKKEMEMLKKLNGGTL